MFVAPSRVSQRAFACALVVGAALATVPAHAHFILQAPASSMSQDALGTPQKLGPCGDEATNPPATPSGVVTAFKEGDTITVTVDGTIPHPGHWRVSLGLTGPKDLPAEPAVTVGSTACGSAAIEDPAVFPVLADNLLPSTTGFTGVQSMQIKLPAGVTCTKCTLQVIQFMSDHALNVPGGCFYHHCADISITSADGGAAGTGGASTGPGTTGSGTTSMGNGGAGAGTTGTGATGAGGAAGDGGTSSAGGCGCSVPARATPAATSLAALLGLAGLLRRRARPGPARRGRAR